MHMWMYICNNAQLITITALAAGINCKHTAAIHTLIQFLWQIAEQLDFYFQVLNMYTPSVFTTSNIVLPVSSFSVHDVTSPFKSGKHKIIVITWMLSPTQIRSITFVTPKMREQLSLSNPAQYKLLSRIGSYWHISWECAFTLIRLHNLHFNRLLENRCSARQMVQIDSSVHIDRSPS